jgi:soluble lytic murein transglycosylase
MQAVRSIARFVRAACALALLSAAAFAAPAAEFDHGTVLDARAAWAKRDSARLAAARAAVMAAPPAARHPLAPWVEYWDLNNRLAEAGVDEVEAFYERWRGSYVEDRLRNDWLLELGRRRDWPAFARDFPRFRMNDDREVTCYALLTEQQAGKDVRDIARATWLAQRDPDDGCALLAKTLFDARAFDAGDVWRKLRAAVEAGRPRSAQQAAVLLDNPALDKALAAALDQPTRALAKPALGGGDGAQLAALALVRLAATDVDAAAVLLEQRWERALPREAAGWAWSQVARQSALNGGPDALARYARAERLAGDTAARWGDDTRAWQARAALRRAEWAPLVQAVERLSEAEQRDPTWVYWKGRALKALAAEGSAGAEQRAAGHALLQSIAGAGHFYAKLAAEDLGEPYRLPPPPAERSAAERAGAAQHAGLDRALLLVGIGLRNEGVREWNYALRGMDERELLAAAELACQRQVWDRCINTSDRTKREVDMAQRFPTPFRAEVLARTRDIGLDAAVVYGLIRQESRFVMDARSAVGASGLMQVMPATARWTAKKLGLRYSEAMLTDRDANLALGTAYLKLVLESFDGSLPLAAAAYNAGPSRARRWRDGPLAEAAIWAENIPFSETRDYVKKVLSNAVDYAALLGDAQPSLRAKLGAAVGPRAPDVPAADEELP